MKVGEIVLLEDVNKKRTSWDLARVENLIPGRDGQIRLTVIKTADSEFFRPVQRLFHLEMDSPVLSVADDSTSVITRSGRLVRRILVENRSTVTATACMLRESHCHFALFFTGGHHGPKSFLGLKPISPPGIPMREEILRKANQLSRILESYQHCEDLSIDVDIGKKGKYWVSGRRLTVERVDSTPLYVEFTSKVFDFAFLKEQVQQNLPKIVIDCSNGGNS
ncbi:integrase catalytic domain-containing protein [Trichonephila inaurata madagascariensis]|uniref:Integrase catalytic domain-containing protein n=1 Tax=Trichonephila inaurata madagascariensis TaxID=2747483 RepID=A0A8X7CEM5_9ARAC|nr:integrase catalytic domain-containing protein [Trichonephila inaurata madagascariensis]